MELRNRIDKTPESSEKGVGGWEGVNSVKPWGE